MKDAFTAFQSGQTNKAIEIYQEIIDSNGEERFTALLNRSSAFYSLGMFPACLNDLDIYLSESPAPRVEGYVLYINTFIQTKTKPSSSQEKIIDKGK